MRAIRLVVALAAFVGLAAASHAEEPLAKLIERLESGDAEARRIAATDIGLRGPAAEDAVSALTKRVRDRHEDTPVRIAAAEALGRIGPGAHDAVSTLRKLLDDRSTELACAAAGALGGIGDTRSVSLLAKSIDAYRTEVREAVVRALTTAGRGAAKEADTLAGALADPDAEVRRLARRALEALGPAAEEAVSVLRIDEGTPELRIDAARIVRSIGPGAHRAAPELRDALGDDYAAMRVAAAAALLSLGEAPEICFRRCARGSGREARSRVASRSSR